MYGALLLALEDPADDPFTEKVKDFYAHLTALRQMARSAPAEQLLEEIFASTGYLAALGVLENGARRREDARRFATFCATSGAGGISALLIRSTTSAPLCSMLSMLFDSIAVETLCATFACAILTDILAM